MDSKKTCPLCGHCVEDDCAWYIKEAESCGMKVLAKASISLTLPINYDRCHDNYYIRTRKV